MPPSVFIAGGPSNAFEALREQTLQSQWQQEVRGPSGLKRGVV